MEYFKIKNWEKYQIMAKKKGQTFSWIRLDCTLLTDPKTYNMSALQFATWIKILLLGRQFDNKMPLDLRWLRRNIGFPAAHQRINIAYFEDLGLIQVFQEPLQTDRQTDRQQNANRGLGLDGPSAQEIPKEAAELIRKLGLPKSS